MLLRSLNTSSLCSTQPVQRPSASPRRSSRPTTSSPWMLPTSFTCTMCIMSYLDDLYNLWSQKRSWLLHSFCDPQNEQFSSLHTGPYQGNLDRKRKVKYDLCVFQVLNLSNVRKVSLKLEKCFLQRLVGVVLPAQKHTFCPIYIFYFDAFS